MRKYVQHNIAVASSADTAKCRITAVQNTFTFEKAVKYIQIFDF